MPDLTREDLAAFVALWPRSYVPCGLVTESTLRVLDALRELATAGGILIVDAPPGAETASVPPSAGDDARAEDDARAVLAFVLQSIAAADDDIPF